MSIFSEGFGIVNDFRPFFNPHNRSIRMKNRAGQ
jgi:hypothetical protein